MPAERARIQLLPDSVINQIAAGEVIERPASVVKELIENSLDAGARQIEIDCELGGTRLIRVRDDGAGIPREELVLALSRHATSKLRRLDDLAALSTLGFRGEALPSIGSVSRLSLVSCADPREGAWAAVMEGRAEIAGPSPASQPPGTSVEVRDLFFNTPARRRFLRSERTEFLHIQDLIRRIALGTSGVGFRFTHNRQQVFGLRPADARTGPRPRLEKLCGAAFAREALPLDRRAGDLHVRGWLGTPELARNQSDLQFLFVNGRAIRDGRLQHAVRLAYRDRLPAGRHPLYVIFLAADPETVDVNVHPAKSEVRFADTRRVHDFLLSTLRRALDGEPAVSVEAQTTRAAGAPPSPAPWVRESGGSYAVAVPETALAVGEDTAAAPAAFLGRALELIGGQLLLSVDADALFVIDVKQAQAKLIGRRFDEVPAGAAVTAQPLLFPVHCEADAVAIDAVTRHGQTLARCGFDVGPSGPNSVLVRAVPAPARGADPVRLVGAVLVWLVERRGEVAMPDLVATIAGVAARSVVPSTPADMDGLLRDLERRFSADELRLGGCCRRLDAEDLRRLLGTSGERVR